MISNDVIRLIREEPVYGLYLSQMEKYKVDSVPLIRVVVNNSKTGYMLLYNEKEYSKIKDDLRLTLLRHEVLHCMYNHPVTMFDLDRKNRMVNQYAMDLEINQYLNTVHIKELKGVHIDDFISNKILKKDDLQKGTRYYFDKLYKHVKNQEPNLPGLLLDSEIEFNDMDVSDQEAQIIINMNDNILIDITETVEKMQGSIPGFLRDILQVIYDSRKVSNWRNVVRSFIMRKFSRKSRLSSYRKSNRFYDQKGIIRAKEGIKAHLYVDISGSMSNEEIKEAAIQAIDMKRYGLTVDMTQFDADTKETKKDISYQDLEKLNILGRGGTEFDPVFKSIKKSKNEYSCAIIVTDGYASRPTISVKIPILWIISSNGLNVDQLDSWPGVAIKIDK